MSSRASLLPRWPPVCAIQSIYARSDRSLIVTNPDPLYHVRALEDFLSRSTTLATHQEALQFHMTNHRLRELARQFNVVGQENKVSSKIGEMMRGIGLEQPTEHISLDPYTIVCTGDSSIVTRWLHDQHFPYVLWRSLSRLSRSLINRRADEDIVVSLDLEHQPGHSDAPPVAWIGLLYQHSVLLYHVPSLDQCELMESRRLCSRH